MTIDSLCVSLRINPDEPPLRNVSIRLTHRNSDTPPVFPDLIRDNRKSPPCFTCSCCFNSGVERQQIGLIGNFTDNLDNAGNLV